MAGRVLDMALGLASCGKQGKQNRPSVCLCHLTWKMTRIYLKPRHMTIFVYTLEGEHSAGCRMCAF
jgi:hypothetical protein